MPLVGSLSILKRSAAMTRVNLFTGWDRGAGSFQGQFNGRLFVADRFKTIYHRPTRRETLSVDVSTSLPTSLVIRQEETGRIFAVSTTELQDVANQSQYDRMAAVHKVTQGELFQDQVSGSGDNLGAVSKVSQGIVFADLELRTEENLPDTHRQQEGNYFMTSPLDPGQVLAKGMWIELNGVTYRVREAYIESGFQLARVESRSDNRENMTYKMPSGAATYTPGSAFSPSTVDRVFTGTVTYAEVTRENQDQTGQDLKVYVDVAHVGFDFKLDEKIVRGSDTYRISQAAKGADGLQWILTLRRG